MLFVSASASWSGGYGYMIAVDVQNTSETNEHGMESLPGTVFNNPLGRAGASSA